MCMHTGVAGSSTNVKPSWFMCACVLVSLNPGLGDTGISRSEWVIEEAVIEVFKKMRGD